MKAGPLVSSMVGLCLLAICVCPGSGEDKARPKVDLKKLKATCELLQRPVTLEFVSTPLDQALDFLSKALSNEKHGLRFDWEHKVLPSTGVNIEAEAQPLGEVLQKMLDQSKWTYAILPNGEILLRPVPNANR